MRKAILLLLCCGLVICSACNKAEPPPTESQISTVSETKTTENKTESSYTIDETITTEKEKSTPVESKQTETSSIVIVKQEPQKTIEIKERNEAFQEIQSEYEEKIIEQEIADSVEVERLVIVYINEFRVAQGDTLANVLPGLTKVARYRADQLIDNFAHMDIREVCGELKYGRYFDMTEYGMDAKYNYYEGYDREAICKGEWFGTADMIARNIAEGFKNSTKHWDYVDDSKYGYIAVGITYNESDKYWYGCVCMSAENYGG